MVIMNGTSRSAFLLVLLLLVLVLHTIPIAIAIDMMQSSIYDMIRMMIH